MILRWMITNLSCYQLKIDCYRHKLTHPYAAYKRHTLAVRTYTGKKWRDKKDIPCKWKPKESWNIYTFIRQNKP